MGGLSAPPPGNQAIKWPESETPAADHDAHVKAFRKRQAWTWKNHLANWINKTLNLLEKWGL